MTRTDSRGEPSYGMTVEYTGAFADSGARGTALVKWPGHAGYPATLNWTAKWDNVDPAQITSTPSPLYPRPALPQMTDQDASLALMGLFGLFSILDDTDGGSSKPREPVSWQRVCGSTVSSCVTIKHDPNK